MAEPRQHLRGRQRAIPSGSPGQHPGLQRGSGRTPAAGRLADPLVAGLSDSPAALPAGRPDSLYGSAKGGTGDRPGRRSSGALRLAAGGADLLLPAGQRPGLQHLDPGTGRGAGRLAGSHGCRAGGYPDSAAERETGTASEQLATLRTHRGGGRPGRGFGDPHLPAVPQQHLSGQTLPGRRPAGRVHERRGAGRDDAAAPQPGRPGPAAQGHPRSRRRRPAEPAGGPLRAALLAGGGRRGRAAGPSVHRPVRR